LKNPSQKIGLVEWLKVKALSSSPSTEKEKKLGKCPKEGKWMSFRRTSKVEGKEWGGAE
jgi:hypothetical protein